MFSVEKLKRLKKERNMTTETLSARSGVPVGTLNKILSGSTVSPRSSTMEALEKVLCDPVACYLERQYRTMRELGYRGGEVLRNGDPVPWYKEERSTYDDLNALPGGVRAELIDGQIFVMEAPAIAHQFIVDYVGDAIKAHIRSRNGKCVPCTAAGVYREEDDTNFLIPDFSVVCDPAKITKKGIAGGPDFVLEVASPSTAKRDRREKFDWYYENGVREYWLIDPVRGNLTAYKMFGEAETVLTGLSGSRGLWIFDGEPLIDLSGIRRIIEKYG